MVDSTDIANRYIAVWNEHDPERRRALLAQNWTDKATYQDPLMSGRGRDEIAGLIDAVHTRFPDFRFSLLGKADGHANHVRFAWALGPDGGEGVIKGTDFVRLNGERLETVVGFLDQVPVAA